MSRPYVESDEKVASAAEATYIFSRQRHSRHNLRVKVISVIDVTSAVATDIILGYKSIGELIPIYYKVGAIGAGVPVVLHTDFLIGPDTRIYALFEDASILDVLKLAVIGEFEE